MNQTKPSTLKIELLSDTTFGRGEGKPGAVDAEVEHDEFGMPFIGGKTVRGLLRDSWLSMCPHFPSSLHQAAERVLGRSTALEDSCRLRIGDAVLPETIRLAVRAAERRDSHRLSREAVLNGFSAVRYQTAETRAGVPENNTFRASRVVLRGYHFESELFWLEEYEPSADDLRVLAMCALATRHGGLLRNRGRGHLTLTLNGDPDLTKKLAEGTNG